MRASYCGTNIVVHEFFHSIHEVAIKAVDYAGFLAIEQATARAVKEGLYVHHPGAEDDGCDPDPSFARHPPTEVCCVHEARPGGRLLQRPDHAAQR